ncbi:MAG: thioredoxin reductase [delta proteobacterium ML8_F1]|nr:MAG: thioredoxin reductase [delta proteobacterium ML8_F1]
MSLDFSINIGGEKAQALDPQMVYDTLVIGGGPAGLGAALYAKRKGLEVGILAERIGGQVLDTSSVENYLGYNFLTGEDMVHNFEAHVKEYKVPITTDVLVEALTDGNPKKVTCSDGKTYQAKTLILATGSKPRKLDVPGEKEYAGRGVAYCAICDGPLFTGREVIVAGGGNSAVEAAIDLSKTSSKVKLVHRSEFRADKVLVDKLMSLENVEVYLNTQIIEIKGENLLTHVSALDKKSNLTIDIPAEGLFVEIGYLPKSELFEGLLALNEKKEVMVNSLGETSVPGIYAAGDLTDGPYKQIVISAADGAKAALSANDFVNKL